MTPADGVAPPGDRAGGPREVLAVNVGSSSIKLQLLDVAADAPRLLRGATIAPGDEPGLAAALSRLSPAVAEDELAVVHRFVHGGDALTGCRLLDDAVEREVERWSAQAPLHNPPALRVARLLKERWPQLRHFAVFDTAWFATLPRCARAYAIDRDVAERHHLWRYGFHGLAHASLWRAFAARSGGRRLISLQLGAGCSISAVRDGQAVDTSMGFSPLEGLVMATRCGDVDAGALLHLLEAGGLDAAGLRALLTARSGLLGVSGESGDMRQLLASEGEGARRAVELYAYRARKYVGAYLAVLGGADGIVFGGGVGEHAPAVRRAILSGLEWAGVRLDDAANEAAVGTAARIDRRDGGVEVWVLPTNEADEMARQAVTAGAFA